jgi:hypothetical protein
MARTPMVRPFEKPHGRLLASLKFPSSSRNHHERFGFSIVLNQCKDLEALYIMSWFGVSTHMIFLRDQSVAYLERVENYESAIAA